MSNVEWLADRAVLPHAIGAGTRIVAAGGRVVGVDQAAPGPGVLRLHGTLFPGFVSWLPDVLLGR